MEWLINYAVAIIAIIAIITVAFKVIYWIASVDKNQNSLKESADRDRKSADSDRSVLRDFMKEIRDDIKKIFERLPSPTLSGNSPLRLSALGQSISVKLGGRTWAEQVAKQLEGTAQGKSSYEIQSQCFDFVEQAELEQSMHMAVLDCAYENGISEDQVLDVLSIELRDIVLSLTGHHHDDIPDKR